MTKENLRSNGLLLLLLVLFIVAKWPHLHYPFFWDESWSYAPGVRLMYNHGPSLMPNAIDIFYSRGHPLFFYASASAFLHLVGGYSYFNAHLFALFITLCLLITVYVVMLRTAGRAAGLVAVAALMLHVGFFVQATFVMPEMLVALFSLLSISAFAARKWVLAGTALTLLLLTKESGIVAGFVLGMAALAMLLNKQSARREKGFTMLSVAVPALITAAFFLLQKQLLGWYLYPEHTGLISFEWGTFFGKFQQSLNYLLAAEVPRYLLYATFGAVLIAALRTRKPQMLLPLFPLGMAYLTGRQKLDFLLPTKLQFGVLTLVLAGSLLFYIWKVAAPAGKKRWVILLTTFCYGYLCFCSINFFTLRYLLAAMVPLTMGLVMLLVGALEGIHQQAIWVAPLVIAVGGFLMFKNDAGIGDMNLQAYNAMHVQEATVRFLEGQKWYQKRIGTSSFQDAEHLRKPYTGFLHTPEVFKDVSWTIDSLTEVIIFNNIEQDKRMQEVLADSSYQRVYRVQNRDVWAEIWAREVRH